MVSFAPLVFGFETVVRGASSPLQFFRPIGLERGDGLGTEIVDHRVAHRVPSELDERMPFGLLGVAVHGEEDFGRVDVLDFLGLPVCQHVALPWNSLA